MQVPPRRSLSGSSESPRSYSGTGQLTVENGGIDANTYKGTCSKCVSGISLTAPTRICESTGAAGIRGTVGGCFAGTSASAPVVAGAAALVKDQYLTNGQAFINDPGRLHTVMLAMGDRHTHNWGDTSTSQMTFDSSRLTGLGRLKMRLLENGANMDPWGNHVLVRSFVSTFVNHTYAPWSLPMPAGTEMV